LNQAAVFFGRQLADLCIIPLLALRRIGQAANQAQLASAAWEKAGLPGGSVDIGHCNG